MKTILSKGVLKNDIIIKGMLEPRVVGVVGWINVSSD